MARYTIYITHTHTHYCIDGERCGLTLQSIFEKAQHPEKVHIGLVESNHADDAFCIEVYCKLYGVTALTRQKVRTDVVKIMTVPETTTEDGKQKNKCPYMDQIHYLAFHKVGAKGPIYARSLTRKLLGNQEYCLQLDAHSAVVPNWDVSLQREWTLTRNEFAVLSTVPPKISELPLRQPGGEQESVVPRMCQVTFRDNGFPVCSRTVHEKKNTSLNSFTTSIPCAI
jgi:Glycosyltransferase (GlcNAc)